MASLFEINRKRVLFVNNVTFPFYFFFLSRNRLESNSEHWNALLLSLREMTEWVIRKDTELSSLSHSPVRGDAASLAKQLVSKSTFRCRY